jgi:hypothetical protein
VVYRRPHDTRPIIAAVAPSREGKVRDKKIYDQARMTNAKGINRDADTGDHGTAMRTPHKKPKGGKLTNEQKPSIAPFQAPASRSSTASAA